jgi:hypothetical protein
MSKRKVSNLFQASPFFHKAYKGKVQTCLSSNGKSVGKTGLWMGSIVQLDDPKEIGHAVEDTIRSRVECRWYMQGLQW